MAIQDWNFAIVREARQWPISAHFVGQAAPAGAKLDRIAPL